MRKNKFTMLVFIIGCLVLSGCNSKNSDASEELSQKEKSERAKQALQSGGMAYAAESVAGKDHTESKELLKLACDYGEAMGCGILGMAFEDEQDTKNAMMYYEQACQGKVANSCYRIGHLYEESNPKKAFKYYQKGCDGNDGESCNSLGWAYQHGEGIEMNTKKAVELYVKSCDANYTSGCANAGFLFYIDAEVEDEIKAANYLQLACDAEESSYFSCNLLGMKYSKGLGVKKNNKKAFDLFEKACKGDDMDGCSNLGISYYNGDGVKRNSTKAKELLKKACDGENENACEVLRQIS